MSDKNKVKSEEKMKIKEEKLTLNGLRENSKEKFKEVISKLGIDEFYTKSDVKQKVYKKFVTAVVPEANFNYMCDLIELPTTQQKYKWLLVVMHLATNIFDIEAMKNKEASTTLKAFQNIIARKILTLPEISIKTDGGTEFKAEFRKYLTDHGVFVKTAQAYNKKQMGPVEGLNNTIARILMNYMNNMSQEMGKDYTEWLDILPNIRVEVNKYRKRNLDELKEYQSKHYFDVTEDGTPEYKIGDFVHFRVTRPIDIHGAPVTGNKFRKGDRIYSIESREIVDILYYPSKPYFRYKLKDMPEVSYSAYDLKPSKQTDNYCAVRAIIGMKIAQKKKYYLVHWRKKLKKDSTWESEEQLIEELREFDAQQNTKKGVAPIPVDVAEPDEDYDVENPYWKWLYF